LTGRTVDNRDIQSKHFMHSGINTVLNYLIDHNYDHPISTKMLQIPAARDFQNIITFLFRQLDPQFEFKDKFEDEVVTMFKFLGYPTQISKSNLTAVGSPHAWPNILAATVWLIELLSYDESVAKGLQSDDTELVSDKAFFDYIATAYSLFMSGKDAQFADLEREFSDSLEAKNTLVEEQVSLLEDRNATLNADITVVNNRRAELPRLEEKRAVVKQDLVKFEELIRTLTNVQSTLQQKTQDREMEMERLTKTLNSINEELESLQHRIDNQELSAEDVSKLVSQKRTLEQAQQRASEHRQAIQKRAWDGETKLRDKHQELIDLAHAYNTVAEELKLIPMTAKNAKGRKFKIEVNINAEKIENILKTDIQETMNNLESLRESLEKQVQSVTKELYTQQEELEEIETSKQELEQKRELTQAKIQRTEETYNKEKEELDKLITMHGTLYFSLFFLPLLP
jgi:kinetochore protein NDC80